jgi:Ca2+-binding EF-hand superfamily protein
MQTNTTWSDIELEELKDAFALFDTEKKGEICVSELRQVLQELLDSEGYFTRSCNLQSLLVSLQKLKSTEKLCLDDFLKLLTSPNPNDKREDADKVFELFDKDGKGYINKDDLRAVSTELGEFRLSDAELHEMIQRVCSSGRVSLDLFRDIMNKKSSL